jgi:2-polyprenyl-3-methyl-5-hydroxy-6-metoxy-1,4-benzoquinol methylase
VMRGERQNREHVRFLKERGVEPLGITTAWALYDDPRRLAFTFSRYKFVAKMFEGFDSVFEVGCADGFVTRIVAQAVGHVTAIDFDPQLIADAKQRPRDRWAIEFSCHDVVARPFSGQFQGIFSLDVLEHIDPRDEDAFISNMIAPLAPNGVVIIGMPSLESQAYASVQSREGHRNCKTMPDLRATMLRYFNNVFMFSMNDEVVHTGYHPMAHYLIALCCSRREEPVVSRRSG